MAAALVVLASCGRVGFDPLGDGDAGGSSDDAGTAEDGTSMIGDGATIDAPIDAMLGTPCPNTTIPTCPITSGFLNTFGTSTVSGPSSGRGDGLAGSCGGAGAEEYTVQFTVQEAATYIFTTSGSDYDTVLYVRADDCAGTELACNDNFGASMTSRVTLALTTGEVVVAVVDGANGLCGDFQLRAGINP